MFSRISGEKFRPVMVIRVPPLYWPWFGEILVMTSSYTKSFAVCGDATAFPWLPSISTKTLNYQGRPPGIPHLI